MTSPRTNNERLARLEENVESIKESQAETKRKVDAMYEAFIAARGAKWVIVALWIGLGAAVANFKWLLQALGVKFNS